MEVFIPKKVFYEKNTLKYKQGKELLEKYSMTGIELIEIDNHHNIEEHRKMSDSEFVDMKKYLILGERKNQRFVPNDKTSDYLVPYTSTGCPAICTYCYLVCNFYKCSYLRVFLNREKLLDRLIIRSIREPNKVFEIGSNSDLVIENTVTGNLEWTISQFAKNGRGKITLPTKFHAVENLLGISHRGKTIIRMSVNPREIIKSVEIGTSNLEDRIEALIMLFKAGYEVGLLVAPVILTDDYERMYGELFEHLADKLPSKLKHSLPVEIIFMTYGHAHKKINEASLKNTFDVYDEEKMKISYRGKYRYKDEYRTIAEDTIKKLFHKYLPESNLMYIC